MQKLLARECIFNFLSFYSLGYFSYFSFLPPIRARKQHLQHRFPNEPFGEKPLKIGHEFTSRGQRFRCVGVEDHLTLREQWIRLIKLEAACADCRRPFSLKASIAAIRRYNLKRRCDRCKAPGIATRATKALQKKKAVALVTQDYEAQMAVRKALRPHPQPRRALAVVKGPEIDDRPTRRPRIPTMEDMFS
ncbi:MULTISPECIES: hypothetical protein [unclassified Bosea (in: a-proteobacteria)]|uniref:hypothetical protein n=1 Tax=unclassified Bosea (in: a-proteobacteria) TaxID=2653178 RepID=UPI000F7D7CF9|nr:MULTISPECIES: hypothetical protein [unclassified Bosea (in: a-proteobacteria)]